MKTFTLTLLALSLLAPFAAQAAKGGLDLACMARDPSKRSGMRVRGILIGNERKYVALEDSEGRVTKAKKFAVVIEIVGGENGQPAREEWEVLGDDEFTLRENGGDNYTVADLKNGFEYACSLNREVHANPAITRSN